MVQSFHVLPRYGLHILVTKGKKKNWGKQNTVFFSTHCNYKGNSLVKPFIPLKTKQKPLLILCYRVKKIRTDHCTPNPDSQASTGRILDTREPWTLSLEEKPGTEGTWTASAALVLACWCSVSRSQRQLRGWRGQGSVQFSWNGLWDLCRNHSWTKAPSQLSGRCAWPFQRQSQGCKKIVLKCSRLGVGTPDNLTLRSGMGLNSF